MFQSLNGGCTHARENKRQPPRERVSRYTGSSPEKRIGHAAGQTETKNPGSVGTREVAAAAAPVVALAMATDRPRNLFKLTRVRSSSKHFQCVSSIVARVAFVIFFFLHFVASSELLSIAKRFCRQFFFNSSFN